MVARGVFVFCFEQRGAEVGILKVGARERQSTVVKTGFADDVCQQDVMRRLSSHHSVVCHLLPSFYLLRFTIVIAT